jgi:23S rRNA (pseudouridine1915-N3)-methyltransferase
VKLVVLCIEQKRIAGLADLISEYTQKIERFVSFEMIAVKGAKSAREDRARKLEAESKALLSELKPQDFVVLLDERGQHLSSLQFSKHLVQAFESGKRRVVVVVGGAYGMSAELKARGQEIWSLSALTLAHPVAMAVLLEQLYRGFTIWKGLPYHNE